jgi:putative ABC transport system permease protein
MYSKEMQIVEGDAAPAGTPVPQGNDPKLAAYYADLRGAVVGDKLMEKKGWKLGQTVTLQGTIWPGDHTFNIRAVYHPTDRSFGDEQFLFHWKYQDQISQAVGMGALQAGWYTISLKDPSMAAAVAQAVDAMFETSADRSKTETERAMQAGFISMWGNVPFLIRVIGLAVVFAILGVAANAMMITFRERTAEIGILKTLGFSDGTVFGLVLAEAAILTLGGGAIGAYGAKYLVESTGFNAGGMLPPMSVYTSTVVQGLLIAAALGALSGIVPATLALRLRIVDALRRA